ncbi:hypothetical protein ABZO31_20945 [Streptomyces sp. HUAS MG47]|uniref:hypothetical protein n=1 Tax=Streptomyces solicamelliae TaxID=3231716 RepID=UPI0038782E08
MTSTPPHGGTHTRSRSRTRTRRLTAAAAATSLVVAGGILGTAAPAQAFGGCSEIAGARACWNSDRDVFTLTDTADDGAYVRVEYLADIAEDDVVGSFENHRGPHTTKRLRLGSLNLPESKAMVWSVSVWAGDRLIEQGPVQYHTT